MTGLSDARQYDIFVSYRSENVHLVRPVAEGMMAAGLKVWFAEYEILLSGRDRFEKAIARGIAGSSYAVCFTNDSYALSDHCEDELRQLLSILGPQRIVEIRCPDEPQTYGKHPRLREARAFDYRDLAQTLRDIGSVTGYDTGVSMLEPQAAPDWRRLNSNGLQFSIDFGGWDVETHRLGAMGGGDNRAATFQTPGNGALRGHLIVGPMDVGRPPMAVDIDTDDRKYYDRALRFAESFYTTALRQRPVGIHLSFVPGNLSQASFTTASAPGVLSRLYSVVVPSSRKGRDVEFAFFFFHEGQIKDFWRRALLLDRLVHSLRVENLPAWPAQVDPARREETPGPAEGSRRPGLARLLPAGLKNRQLGKAVLAGDLDAVRRHLSGGADPDRTSVAGVDGKGRKLRGTPLMVASAEGLESIVVELLAHGARVDCVDSRNWNALFYAVENGYEKVCRLLLDSGTNPNATSTNAATVLMIAAIKGHAEIVGLLLERGASLGARDGAGKTALDYARKYGWSDIEELLEGDAR